MITSSMLNDFTLTAMVISFDLTVRMRQAVATAGQNDNNGFRKHLAAIETAHI